MPRDFVRFLKAPRYDLLRKQNGCYLKTLQKLHFILTALIFY